jgi:hypothetical protein
MNRRVGEVRSGCFRVWGGGAREREREREREAGERRGVECGEWFEVKLPFFPPLLALVAPLWLL